MKVRKRPMPMDMLSVEQDNRSICISTHRQSINFGAYDKDRNQVAWHEFTFEQLFALLEQLRPGIQDHVTTRNFYVDFPHPSQPEGEAEV